MSHQGAALQGFNNELVKCHYWWDKSPSLVGEMGIEELCSRREELHRQILEEEEEKRKLSHDVRLLTERLAKVNDNLSKKMATRNEFDKTIAETEAAYMKILESSQTLLTVLKKESQSLSIKVESSSSPTSARHTSAGRPPMS